MQPYKKFLTVCFVKREFGPEDAIVYLNIDNIASFTWSDEGCNGINCIKWVVYYVNQQEADIFWIRHREFFQILDLLAVAHSF